MNSRFTICYLLFCLSLLAGCDQPQATGPTPVTQEAGNGDGRQTADDAGDSNPPSEIRNLQLPAGFAPARISILPLTELPHEAGSGKTAVLNAYVGLLDAFGSQIKAPGVLRFELYQYVPRSAQSKGQRIAIWPDIDLTHPGENNKYWRDFLRAYEFTLDAPAGLSETYVLEATCLCPDGRRLSAEFPLKGGK
jgi:hypothetical protein